MAAMIRYVALLVAVTNVAIALPQGNSGCAQFCQDNYAQCGFKNVGQCTSNAAQNGNTCSCCPNGGVYCPQKSACVQSGQCTTSATTTATFSKITPTSSTSKASTTSTKTTPTSSSTSKTSTTSTKTLTTTTSTAATATPTINNGQIFTNQCTNTGVSVADCAQLLNIAALNGNSLAVGGGTSSSGSNPVNNGQQFLNQCNNSGISILDCSQLLNLAILNGNNIDISLIDLTSLLTQLGLPPGLASLLPSTGNGLLALPAGAV